MTREELVQSFYEVYGKTGGEPVCVFSPGRVNLIGEHTDYNGGHVFPCALTIGTYFAARKRGDRRVRFFSGNFSRAGLMERSLDRLEFDPSKGFSNYLMGMIWTYREKRGLMPDTGMDIYLKGDMPHASGLSSSASVEVGMGQVLNALFGFEVDPFDLAVLGQFSENHYNGLNCGIMDQFAIAMGKKDRAIFLDTAALSYEYAPIALDGMKILIICTNKKRGLVDSKYNERRAECDEAVRELRQVVEIQTLGELSPEVFDKVKYAIANPTVVRRARHAVYENERTVRAVELLKAGDIEGFGKLMNQSHISLRDDYEVTGIELDTIAEAAWKVDGCIGARMTGAGFGGCAVAIVKDEAVESFREQVGKAYLEKVGYAADFYAVEIGDGTHVF
ncbi:MAG: galactokinase [Lachnospiraceae bacterium]|nr:galactokinase [Lachnospiraceae bacterium]